MSSAWHSLRSTRSAKQNDAAHGFTLVETTLSLVVIVLVASLIFSVLQRTRQQSQCQRWAGELKRIAAGFTDYRTRNGRWPATPNELGGQFIAQGWSRGSPFGGVYNWRPPTEAGQPGLIMLTAFHPGFPLTLTSAELIEVDRQIDDGNLKTGRFRTGFNGWPVYQVSEKP